MVKLFKVLAIILLGTHACTTYCHAQPERVGLMRFIGSIDDSFQKKVEPLITASCNDSQYSAIIIIADSGGGSATISEELYHTLSTCQQNSKPVVVFIPRICASGCYWVMMQADSIIASPFALVPSIGTYHQLSCTPQNITSKNGESIFQHHFSSKTAKQWCHSDNSTRKELETQYHDESQVIYDTFVGRSKQHRPLLDSNSITWAEGAVFIAQTALKKGLIDQVGSYTTLIDTVKNLIRTKTGKEISDIDIVEVKAH